MTAKPLSKLIEQELPRNGDTKKLGLTREYLNALKEGKITAVSREVLIRLQQEYNLQSQALSSIEQSGKVGNPFEDKDQGLLNFFEQGAKYNHEINKEINRRDSISKEDMKSILQYNAHKIIVPGTLPLAVFNLANVFPTEGPQQFSLFDTADEFPILTKERNSLRVDEFVEQNIEKTGIKTYTVNEEFLPHYIKRMYTDSELWKRKYNDNSEGFFKNTERSVGEYNNKVIIEFKNPLPKKMIKSVNKDIVTDPSFSTLKTGYGNVWIAEQLWASDHSQDGQEKMFTGTRPIVSFQDESSLKITYYPFHVLSPWTGSTFDEYRPTVNTMRVLNRMSYRMHHHDNE
ncbi:MAG: hypothetical protein ACQESC_02170 [Nanobdellota archaeon]